MSIIIPVETLRTSAKQLKRTAGDIEDGLGSLLNQCYVTGPTMRTVANRTPKVLDATGERLGEHIRDFSGTVSDAADKAEKLDGEIGGNGGG